MLLPASLSGCRCAVVSLPKNAVGPGSAPHSATVPANKSTCLEIAVDNQVNGPGRLSTRQGEPAPQILSAR
jgi:hypothetical protein